MAFMFIRLHEIPKLSGDSLVSIGNSNPCHWSCVAPQEQERHVASCGHQVHQHGHPDGSQSRQAELLHQEATQKYAQTRAWDGCHACKRKKELEEPGFSSSSCSRWREMPKLLRLAHSDLSSSISNASCNSWQTNTEFSEVSRGFG